MTEVTWQTQLTTDLINSGVEPDEARRLTADAVAEAIEMGQSPGRFYGPATSYAATIAAAVRSAAGGPPLDAQRGEVVLRLSQVGKRYRRRTVLRDVNLTLHGGQVAAVVGANGAGKSTLLSICAGIIRASNGTVERSPRLGYAPQEHGIAPLLTAAEHFRLFGAVYGVGARKSVSVGNHLAAQLGWRPRPGVVANQLSGGTQQKLNVVLSELDRPDLILLDEPYQGFDQHSYLDFWNQVFAWRDAGAGILVVTHLLHDLDRVDHVLELPRVDES